MPITYQYLTDRTLVTTSAITTDTLIHVVNTNDLSQNPAGSSYKAKLSQILPALSGLTFTGGSSNCISDLYVSNIHSCSPLLINKLNEGNVYFGSTSGITLDVINKRIGINTNNPQHSLHISGNTLFNGTLSATTISATTYLNLPTTTNGYLPLSGGTVTGGTVFTSGLSANTLSATTYLNLPTIVNGYLPLSGGTVTGGTSFTSGLTANTLNVNGLTRTSGITSTSGIIFKQVTINGSYTATTSDYMIDITGGTFTVSLPTAVGQQGRLYVIKNNGGGAVTVDPFGSETIDGKSFIILGETNSIQLASNGTEWVAMSYNISTVNSSTGVFEFSGMTIASPTTFTVAPIKGWIVDDTTNPLSPQLYYVTYSGGTHTATYVTATTATWIYLTSGGTIAQSNIPITDQQRRQNISLGKLGHANKTNIINAFSQPDFVLSPLAQLRDMFEPINLINGGIKTSANGANLSFNTSAGYLHGLGINFANDTLTPNSLYVTGTAPCTFQYRTQTGGTASNTTFIDPTKKDVGGVVTTLSGTKATNQRIYLVQNGVFRVQYGQVEYSNLTQAIAGIATEQFVEFTNFTTNGILIGVLSVLSTATDLTDTTKAQFFNVSKFGDSTGAAGGSPTTNLQQAYNNSVTPEITTNSTLGALTVKNGAGTADNVTNVFEGVNTAGSTTSFVRADGAISATTISGTSLNISGGSSSDLVRITQTGIGNSFVVEDSTNPDSTPFVIDTSGNTGIGTTTPTAKLHIKGIDSSSSNISFKVEDSSNRNILSARNDNFVYVGDNSVSSYLWLYGLGGQFGFSNENGFPYLFLSSSYSGGKFYFSNGSTGSAAFAQINTSNGNWLIGNPNTAIFGSNLTDTKLTLQGVDSTSSNFGLKVQKSGGTDIFVVRNDGNVGIGIPSPTQKLQVSGNTLINGTLSATTISATTYQNLPTKEVFYKSHTANEPVFELGGFFEPAYNGGTGPVYISGIIPYDFGSNISSEIILIPTASETHTIDLNFSSGPVGGSFSATTANINFSKTYTQNIVDTVNVDNFFSGITANQVFSLNVFDNGNYKLVIGIKFKYKPV